MNRSLLKACSVVALCVTVFVARSNADMINGVVTFGGSVTLDTTNVNTATKVTSWVNTHVEDADGDFGTYISHGDAVTIAAPWSFNSGAVAGFWSVGGFTFDLTQSAVAFDSLGYLAVGGTGIVTGHGFDASLGTWSFTTQNSAADGKFSFSAASSVPDGGITALLLGMGLVGLALASRFRSQLVQKA